MTGLQEISGEGVTAMIDGLTVAAGNEKLMRHVGVGLAIATLQALLCIWP